MDLLDTCETIDDARTILEWDGDSSVGFRDHFTKYPRIEDALECGLEEFIGHDYCQQILGEDWISSRETSNTIQKQRTNIIDIVLYGLSSLLFLPLHLTGCLYSKLRRTCYTGGSAGDSCNNILKEHVFHLAYPYNRYVTHTVMFALYVLAILGQGYMKPNYLLLEKKENASNFVHYDEVAQQQNQEKGN